MKIVNHRMFIPPLLCRMKATLLGPVCGKRIVTKIHYNGMEFPLCLVHARHFQRLVEHDKAGRDVGLPQPPELLDYVLPFVNLEQKLLDVLSLYRDLLGDALSDG